MKTYQIHLIRNGRTDSSASGRYIGHTDVLLSPEGVAEIHRLKNEAVYSQAEAVFTSPLKRCTQTAHAIFPDREPIEMRELMEYDFGEYEGKTPEQLADDEGFAAWLAGGPEAAPPFGESNAEFSARVCGCFAKIVEGMMKAQVPSAAIITHGGVIMTLLSAFGIPELPMPEWRTPNACGYTVRITPSVWMRCQKAEVIAEIPAFPQEEASAPDLDTQAFYVDLEELRTQEDEHVEKPQESR